MAKLSNLLCNVAQKFLTLRIYFCYFILSALILPVYHCIIPTYQYIFATASNYTFTFQITNYEQMVQRNVSLLINRQLLQKRILVLRYENIYHRSLSVLTSEPYNLAITQNVNTTEIHQANYFSAVQLLFRLISQIIYIYSACREVLFRFVRRT